jgi:hypothetical protein
MTNFLEPKINFEEGHGSSIDQRCNPEVANVGRNPGEEICPKPKS